MARRKVEVRREEILRATVDEVTRLGFAHTRVADVAEALGISTGLVFYHFDSKDALLSAAFAYAAERDLERLDGAANGTGSAARGWPGSSPCTAPRSGAGWSLWIDAATSMRSREMAEVSQASTSAGARWPR
jgi:AcrR family transcriptional regulator